MKRFPTGSSLTVLLVTLLACGCSPSPSTTAPPEEMPALDAPQIELPAEAPAEELPAEDAAGAATPAAAPQAPAAAEPAAVQPAAAVETTQEKARAGAGQAGRTLSQELGTTAVKTYFLAKEKVVFEIQLPAAMNLYKASNGHAPKTQEEFMEQIIKANQIQLPTLPPNHRYVYDPQTEELMVEHPK